MEHETVNIQQPNPLTFIITVFHGKYEADT